MHWLLDLISLSQCLIICISYIYVLAPTKLQYEVTIMYYACGIKVYTSSVLLIFMFDQQVNVDVVSFSVMF
jgi:hypothetical protein